MIEKFALNDIELWLEHKGEGQPLVFIHGFSLDARMWDCQFETFQTAHKVIRYDLRGFGNSGLPKENYRHSDDLLAILDYLKLEKVSLIGFSLGGGVAVDFALAYPDRLNSLVLVDSTLEGYSYSKEWREGNKAIWIAAKTDIEQARNLWINHPLFKSVLVSEASQSFRGMLQDYSGWHWQNRDPQVHLSEPVRERLKQISAPTLIVVGDQDLADFLTISEILTQIPHSKRVALPQVGHMASMENPKEFNQILKSFLQKNC